MVVKRELEHEEDKLSIFPFKAAVHKNCPAVEFTVRTNRQQHVTRIIAPWSCRQLVSVISRASGGPPGGMLVFTALAREC